MVPKAGATQRKRKIGIKIHTDTDNADSQTQIHRHTETQTDTETDRNREFCHVKVLCFTAMMLEFNSEVQSALNWTCLVPAGAPACTPCSAGNFSMSTGS